MTDEEKGTGIGTVVLSFFTGAALGIGLALLYAQTRDENGDAECEEGPLFI
ncbi:hypothetical protein [Geobacter sp. DSM 9736]|uniref:hypothetical protein n=1 Tax=Geobacter sp. DSM 9736 TaxID=1277350 RepID=UPI000B5E0AF5|nr:hypothetical protein [Geobacter sp. DSM 9736]SNB46105.1 hypothetical protein SAMN06269301_1545 [Geobacter sp. DSM 9736]